MTLSSKTSKQANLAVLMSEANFGDGVYKPPKGLCLGIMVKGDFWATSSKTPFAWDFSNKPLLRCYLL